MGYKVVSSPDIPVCCYDCENCQLTQQPDTITCKWHVMIPTKKHTCRRQHK